MEGNKELENETKKEFELLLEETICTDNEAAAAVVQENLLPVGNDSGEAGATQKPEIIYSNDVESDSKSSTESDTEIVETPTPAVTANDDAQQSSSEKVQQSSSEGCLEGKATHGISHANCTAQRELQRLEYENQLSQLRAALIQKENVIALFQRENEILEKEKQAFRKEKELANKEKEATVIKFAMKEKLLLDAKKEKELIEKQLVDAKKEIKNVSTRFQAVNEEKSRITYIMDEKCTELRKYQRECEKLKTDYAHLESKLKYHANKLNMEIEAKMALEKKLEEERNVPNKMEEKTIEKLKVEYEANSILLKHEIEQKTEMIDNLSKENIKFGEIIKQLQEQLSKQTTLKNDLEANLTLLQDDHNAVQKAYSEEMLNSAKLRCQLDELQVLKTQNTLNEEKIRNLNETIKRLTDLDEDTTQNMKALQKKSHELLSLNKEMSESIVILQNELCLLKAKAQGIEAENEIYKKEKLVYDTNYESLQKQIKILEDQKTEISHLLTKHLSEKTKQYETTKIKLENVMGEAEVAQHKHATIVKELQREIIKYKKSLNQMSNNAVSTKVVCSNCQSAVNGYISEQSDLSTENTNVQHRSHSRSSSHSHSRSHSDQSSQQQSESSESETVASNSTTVHNDFKTQTPSKKMLVERILRLQQASARQTEKIDFLENHTLSLVAELQKKSKVVQYYMLRDQAGALTSSKSDQNKSELAKYGNGVMSAIYNGIKGDNNSMTLDLSLEINKKLQAVLEDTLLKNITLKENLDVLGLEVENLTRKLRKLEGVK